MIRAVLTRALVIGMALSTALAGATSAAGAAAPVTAPPDTTPPDAVPIDPALATLFEQLPAWLADPATVPEDAFDPAFLAEVARTTGIRPALSRPSRSAVPGKARTGLVLSSLSNSSFWRAARPKAVHSPGPSEGEPSGMAPPRERRNVLTASSQVRPATRSR